MARGREGFVDGDGHGGQFGARHAREVEEREGGVDEGDVEVWGLRGEVSWLVGWWCFIFIRWLWGEVLVIFFFPEGVWL